MNFIIDFWQYLPYYLNPVAFYLGPIQIRWYSIMYLSSILSIFFLYISYCKKNKLVNNLNYSYELLIYSFIGIIIGARLGYALFYEPLVFLSNPLKLINPFENGTLVGISGLSYHGGALGFITAIVLYCKKYKINFFQTTNILSLYIPLGYTLGRIGNFLNLELYGKATNLIIGMYFPNDSTQTLKYPSQIAEAFVEGILIFFILKVAIKYFPLSKKIITPLYCLLYGFARFFIEFIREPDVFQSLFINIFTYGQFLSIIMILWGITFIPIYLKHYEKTL